jgi:hypothetical protein
MANLNVNFSESDVRARLQRSADGDWVVVFYSDRDKVEIEFSKDQMEQLQLFDTVADSDSEKEIDYRDAAYDYLFDLVVQDEQYFSDNYDTVAERLEDLYGKSFDMETFCGELDTATVELKKYLSNGGK